MKLLIYPGARSEPRGKKVNIHIYILAYTIKETVRKTHYWLEFPFKEQRQLEVEILADNYENNNNNNGTYKLINLAEPISQQIFTEMHPDQGIANMV